MDMFEYITHIGYLGWFTIGLVLVLLEMAIPGCYLIWFGFSAFVMGILVHFFEFTAIETCVWFALISAFFAAFGWYVYAKAIRAAKVPEKYKYLNDMAGAHIGKIYNLSEDVVDGRAKAKVGDTFWLVEIHENLKKGDKIRVVGVDNGVILRAEKYDDKNI